MNFARLTVCSGLALSMASSAWGADGTPASSYQTTVAVKHWMKDSLHVQFTPRGLTLFRTKLLTIFANQGLSLDEGNFDPQHFDLAPIDLLSDSTSASNKELIQNVTSTLHTWLTGFPLLTKVQPSIDLGASGYTAKFKTFSLSTDEKLLKSLNKPNGVVLVLDLEIEKIKFRSSQVRVWDAFNPNLGQVGLNNPVVKIADSGVPLKIHMPFLVQIDGQGLPHFQALGFDQNINLVNIDLSYQKLVVPTVEVLINGHPYNLDQTQLNTNFRNQTPALLDKIREELHTLASEQIPKILNEKAKQNLVSAIEQIQTLDAPGAPTPSQPLLWGLQLDKPSLHGDLEFSLSSFVEDPLNPNSNLLEIHANQSPQMSALAEQSYDVGLALDEGMINRMLQLSFERKLFANLQVGSGGHSDGNPKCGEAPSDGPPTFLQILEPPQIQGLSGGGSTGTQGETLVSVHAKLRVPKGTVTGLGTWLINDNFILSGNLILKLKKSANGRQISMHLWDVDQSSLVVDPSGFTGLGSILFKGAVMSKISDTFKGLVQTWRCEDVQIPGAIPTPEIYGIGLQLSHLMMESSGHLVLYMEYVRNSGSPR